MSDIDYGFEDRGDTLVLICQVAKAWRRHPKTYCYSSHLVVPMRNDNKARVTVSVFPRPSGFSSLHKEWPNLRVPQTTVTDTSYSLSDGILKVRMPLYVRNGDERIPNVNLPWRKDKKLTIHLQQRYMATKDSIEYELQVLWVLQDKPGDSYTRFENSGGPSAGLPSLGKRK